MEKMIYDPKLNTLIDVISYGCLGQLNTIVQHSNDPPHTKCNVLLVNISSMIRNNFEDNVRDHIIAELVRKDLIQLRNHYNAYATEKSHLIFYFAPNIRKQIPEFAQKKLTPKRAGIDRLTKMLADGEGLKSNHLMDMGGGTNVTYYGIRIDSGLPYAALSKLINSSLPIQSAKVWLISHCPLDYFLFESFPQMKLLESHTGRLIGKRELAEKTFKDGSLPFNRTMLKLMGDKDYVHATLRNKPKAMEILGGVNLKAKTEAELISVAKKKWGIEPAKLNWKI